MGWRFIAFRLVIISFFIRALTSAFFSFFNSPLVAASTRRTDCDTFNSCPIPDFSLTHRFRTDGSRRTRHASTSLHAYSCLPSGSTISTPGRSVGRPGVQPPAHPRAPLPHRLHKSFPVLIVLNNCFPPIAPAVRPPSRKCRNPADLKMRKFSILVCSSRDSYKTFSFTLL